jgi:lipopolysaccharide export system permease protein
VLWYYLYSVPNIFLLTSPVAVLLAVLIAVSLRARANEFTALFSGGISIWRVCAPLLAGWAVFSVLSLACSETLAPRTNRKAREIVQFAVKPGKVEAQFSLNRYWIRGENGILSAQVINPGKQKLFGFQYLEVDEDFRLVRRIDARSATFLKDGKWVLRRGTERRFSGNIEVAHFTKREFFFPETLLAFLEGEAPPEEMTYARLSDYIRDSIARGYDVRRYEVDLHAKLSYPLLNLIVSLVAIPFALRSPRSGGVWRSIGAGLFIGFVCWILLSTSLSLGKKGVLPPLLAAWFPGLAIAAAGAFLFRSARR